VGPGHGRVRRDAGPALAGGGRGGAARARAPAARAVVPHPPPHPPQAVYAAAFSPDGALLASAGFDRRVHIWSVADGALVRTFAGRGGAFDVAWAPDGTRLAAAFADRSVTVLDLRA